MTKSSGVRSSPQGGGEHRGRSHTVRVVHTVDTLRADHGGPSRSVTALCSHLAREVRAVELVAYRRREGEPAPILPSNPSVTVRFAAPESAWRPLLSSNSEFSETVMASLGNPSLVHNHGLWMPSHHAAAQTARRFGVPLVISIRGMLTVWALDQKRFKKRLAWNLYQEQDLRSARLLHATSEEEVEDIRRAGLRQPVVVLPNGVDIPEREREVSAGAVRRALFLSRLHPKKGLLNLVQAWAQVRPEGWELVLAGPDADSHRAEVERAVRELGVESTTRFLGPVEDEDKWVLYRQSDLFVLPTFSENFGIVVAEALAAGLPAVTTTGAPWSVLSERQCGWWIDVGVEPLTAALREATALTDETRHAMGCRGRSYVEEALSWKRIAEEMAAAYRWVLGNGECPPNVALD